jgi:DNA-binding transcriptional ArsR family regulator
MFNFLKPIRTMNSLASENSTDNNEATPDTEDYSELNNFALDKLKESEGSTYVVPKYEARKLLTPNRIDLIGMIREEDIYSMRDLSRKLGRDIKNISEDLKVLKEYDIIEYREEGNRKIPEITADKIVIEPL